MMILSRVLSQPRPSRLDPPGWGSPSCCFANISPPDLGIGRLSSRTASFNWHARLHLRKSPSLDPSAVWRLQLLHHRLSAYLRRFTSSIQLPHKAPVPARFSNGTQSHHREGNEMEQDQIGPLQIAMFQSVNVLPFSNEIVRHHALKL